MASFIERMGPPWESCPDGVLKSLGRQRKGQRPRIYVSRERWRCFISSAWRLRVLNNTSSKPSVFYLLSSCHCLSSTSNVVICTHGLKLPHQGHSPRFRSPFHCVGVALGQILLTLPAPGQTASAWLRGEEGHLCI